MAGRGKNRRRLINVNRAHRPAINEHKSVFRLLISPNIGRRINRNGRNRLLLTEVAILPFTCRVH